MRRFLPPIRQLHWQRSDHSRKGPIGDMSDLPEYQAQRVIPSDHSRKSTVSDRGMCLLAEKSPGFDFNWRAAKGCLRRCSHRYAISVKIKA
jgi:hypothetical protein